MILRKPRVLFAKSAGARGAVAGLATWQRAVGRSTAVCCGPRGRGGPPVHGGPGPGLSGARVRRGSGPWWTGRAGAEPRSTVDHTPERARRPGGAASGGAMGADWELPAAALQYTKTRSDGRGGRGSARRTRWRAHLRESTTVKRSPTAAARTRRDGSVRARPRPIYG